MRFATILATLPVTLATLISSKHHARAANPITDSIITVGPASLDVIKARVADMEALGVHPNQSKRDASGSLLSPRLCEGVYICDGSNFTGDCYWACYPTGVAIYPDSSWVNRIVSVGPDSGQGYCEFYAGTVCDDTVAVHTLMSYPGGDLPGGIANDMGCFFCD